MVGADGVAPPESKTTVLQTAPLLLRNILPLKFGTVTENRTPVAREKAGSDDRYTTTAEK